ncbi:MAG: homoserine O-acetyltransferase [Acidobacteriia bacterium]|nr:homoserine O-acetyltransferase [Terriglobia bacterium]
MDEHRDLWWDSPTVELGNAVHLDLPDGLTCVQGGRLTGIQVSYESWGALNESRDNAVLVIHPLAFDCHVSGDFAGQPHGWWEQLVGPGRAIDTRRYFVVCPNLLGGCYGTTGPRFPAPDGEPYLTRFPLLTPLDMMRVQRLFLRQLGIERLRMVIGASMGGMLAWEWAIEAGEEVDLVVVVAAPLRTTPLQIGWNWLQRRGVELDINGNEASSAWGQMVARGVGMLSYRSPTSLEEKFGRDWFKPPGSTLGERGMFNVESWLRYQGLKSIKRFDPYTYILFTRAMDLFDVSVNRGSVVNALEQVRCRTLVVGISSDQLYPAADVHLGADILNHLGKPVEYAELRSPHGHDAFLLETEQISAILRDVHARKPLHLMREVPSVAQREVRTVRLGILGAGRVTGMFLRLLAERHAQLIEDYNLRLEVAAVADIDPSRTLDPDLGSIELGFDPEKLVRRDDIDVVIEATRGSDTHGLLEIALQRKRSVATTNKFLIKQHGPHLEQFALAHGVRLAYHNAIAAGWPLLYAVERPLAHLQIQTIQAVLSSTCNVILEQMEQGHSFASALNHARSLGISEPDPELDLSGWDTAQKLLILCSRAQGLRFGVEELNIRGIYDLDPVLVRDAPPLGLRIKLVGLFMTSPESPTAGVLPLAVPAEGHLGSVRTDNNVVVLAGEETGEMVYLGKGSGRLPVAAALLNDVIGLYHSRHSWTGRFPRAAFELHAPRFATFLARDDRATVLTDTPREGSIPLLDSLIWQHGK